MTIMSNWLAIESKWLHSSDKITMGLLQHIIPLGCIHGFEVASNWTKKTVTKNEYEFWYAKIQWKDGFCNKLAD